MARTDRSARSSISSSTPGMKRCRHGGIVRDVAVLSAIGIGPDERRRVLGVSVALSEAEVHWRAFLESLVARACAGSTSSSPMTTAACAPPGAPFWGGATWQRCQFHLARNAIHHAPQRRDPKAHRQTAEIDLEKRTISNKAETALAELVASYRDPRAQAGRMARGKHP